jgi:hypothetical protein
MFPDFSGLEEVINCFGLKALLLGRSLRGRIKVNKQKGAVSSKDFAPTFLHYEEENAPFAAGARILLRARSGPFILLNRKSRVMGS